MNNGYMTPKIRTIWNYMHNLIMQLLSTSAASVTDINLMLIIYTVDLNNFLSLYMTKVSLKLPDGLM